MNQPAPPTDPALIERLHKMLAVHGCDTYGFADVAGLVPERLGEFPLAVSLALAMDPAVMAGIENGPTQQYSELYDAVNQRLNALCAKLARAITEAGHSAWPVPASVRSDPVNIKGDFPHKTAATRAGLGWIGRHCQLINPRLGPWLRLGTVLTNAPLPVARPMEKNLCGKCDKCVSACPAGALSGSAWHPGLERAAILDVRACDTYKKTHFMHLHQGHNCGICTSACPVGRKLLRKARA